MLAGFFEAFRTHLIGSLTPGQFADLFAQTITYGLFAARIRGFATASTAVPPSTISPTPSASCATYFGISHLAICLISSRGAWMT